MHSSLVEKLSLGLKQSDLLGSIISRNGVEDWVFKAKRTFCDKPFLSSLLFYHWSFLPNLVDRLGT